MTAREAGIAASAYAGTYSRRTGITSASKLARVAKAYIIENAPEHLVAIYGSRAPAWAKVAR